jgi:hypothetical protein
MSLWGMPQRVKNCAKCAVRCVGDAGDIRMLEKHAAISVENANGIDRVFRLFLALCWRCPGPAISTIWLDNPVDNLLCPNAHKASTGDAQMPGIPRYRQPVDGTSPESSRKPYSFCRTTSIPGLSLSAPIRLESSAIHSSFQRVVRLTRADNFSKRVRALSAHRRRNSHDITRTLARQHCDQRGPEELLEVIVHCSGRSILSA